MRINDLAAVAAVLCLGIAFAPAPARAQFTLSIAPTPTNVLPGNQISLLTTLTNNTGVTLSDFSFSLNITTNNGNVIGLFADDTDFELNLPDPLANNTSFSNNIFLQASNNATPGLYNLRYEITANSGAFTATANRPFTVGVGTAAPEGGYGVVAGLCATALLGMTVRRRAAFR